jgi:hypothetical protein
VALAYNPVYSGGRNQEDHHSKLAKIVQETLSQKLPSQKGLKCGVAQGVGPEFKPQHHKKKKKKEHHSM